MTNKYEEIVENLDGYPPSQGSPALPLPVSDEQLDKFEMELGFPLPADYREFLQDYSGYGFSNPVFPVVENGRLTTETVFAFYDASPVMYQASIENYDPDSDTVSLYLGLALVRSMMGVKEIGWPPELLPIACDMGGNQICLALSGLRPGAIFFWVNAPGEGSDNIYLVANSFDEFIHLLRPST